MRVDLLFMGTPAALSPVPWALSPSLLVSSSDPATQMQMLVATSMRCFSDPSDSQKTRLLLSSHCIQGSVRHTSSETPGSSGNLSIPHASLWKNRPMHSTCLPGCPETLTNKLQRHIVSARE